MNTLEVKPVYGFGWEQNGKRIETPAPFVLNVEKVEGKLGDRGSWVFGTILGPHRFSGKFSRLQIRTLAPTASFNVYIYDSAQLPLPQALSGRFDATTVATGFAEIL